MPPPVAAVPSPGLPVGFHLFPGMVGLPGRGLSDRVPSLRLGCARAPEAGCIRGPRTRSEHRRAEELRRAGPVEGER